MRLEAMAHVLWQRRMEEEAAQRCQLALAITFFAALASSARLRLDRPSPLPTLAPALLSRNFPAGLACLARPRRRSSRRVGGRARPQFLFAALARRCGAPAPPPSLESDASLSTQKHTVPGPKPHGSRVTVRHSSLHAPRRPQALAACPALELAWLLLAHGLTVKGLLALLHETPTALQRGGSLPDLSLLPPVAVSLLCLLSGGLLLLFKATHNQSVVISHSPRLITLLGRSAHQGRETRHVASRSAVERCRRDTAERRPPSPAWSLPLLRSPSCRSTSRRRAV